VVKDHWSPSNGYKSSRTLQIEIKAPLLLAPLQSIQEKQHKSVFEALAKIDHHKDFKKSLKV